MFHKDTRASMMAPHLELKWNGPVLSRLWSSFSKHSSLPELTLNHILQRLLPPQHPGQMLAGLSGEAAAVLLWMKKKVLLPPCPQALLLPKKQSTVQGEGSSSSVLAIQNQDKDFWFCILLELPSTFINGMNSLTLWIVQIHIKSC